MPTICPPSAQVFYVASDGDASGDSATPSGPSSVFFLYFILALLALRALPLSRFPRIDLAQRIAQALPKIHQRLLPLALANALVEGIW